MIVILAGVLAGIGTGFAGLSAAVFISPMLTVFLDLSAYEAIGIALASDVLASAVSAVTYARNGNVDLRRGRILAASVVFFAIVGSLVSWLFVSLSFGNSFMTWWMIAATVCLGLNFLLRPGKENGGIRIPGKTPAAVISLLGGAYIGLVCGFQGTGGGLMMLFVLNILLGFPFKKAVGTSVLIMSVTALIGAITHFSVNGIPDLQILMLSVLATLISARAAAVIANRVGQRTLKRLTGTLMVVSGMIMLAVELN